MSLPDRLDPLSWNVPITDASGRPTPEFMRKWAAQRSIIGAIPDLSVAPKHSVLLGEGVFQPGFVTPGTNGQLLIGQTGADPAFKTMSQDGTLSAAGALTVTGLQTHPVSATNPTNGQTLIWNGAAWVPGMAPQFSAVILDGTDYYVATIVSLADPEYVFAAGVPVYVKNPPIPNKAPFYWRIYNNATVAVTSTVAGVLPCDTAMFDPQSWADITVNKGRVTPKVAGRYQISVGIRMTGTGGPAVGSNLVSARILLNGAIYSVNTVRAQVAALAAGACDQFAFTTDIVTVNGTTDFIEAGYESDSTGPSVVGNGTTGCFFAGAYLGP